MSSTVNKPFHYSTVDDLTILEMSKYYSEWSGMEMEIGDHNQATKDSKTSIGYFIKYIYEEHCANNTH